MPEGEGLSQGWSAVGWAGSWLRESRGHHRRGGSEGPTSSESVSSAPGPRPCAAGLVDTEW